MTRAFDKTLTEFTYLINSHLVHVYKVGGGTPGHHYTGRWGYQVLQNGMTLASGNNLRADVPKTHEEVAALAVEMATLAMSKEAV